MNQVRRSISSNIVYQTLTHELMAKSLFLRLRTDSYRTVSIQPHPIHSSYSRSKSNTCTKQLSSSLLVEKSAQSKQPILCRESGGCHILKWSGYGWCLDRLCLEVLSGSLSSWIRRDVSTELLRIYCKSPLALLDACRINFKFAIQQIIISPIICNNKHRRMSQTSSGITHADNETTLKLILSLQC